MPVPLPVPVPVTVPEPVESLLIVPLFAPTKLPATLPVPTVTLPLARELVIVPSTELEQISLGSNREDSQRFINERVCRH